MGYPVGGDTISVTSGVVSRIEVTDYGHGSQLLGIQIDAAINFGNSGEPAAVPACQCAPLSRCLPDSRSGMQAALCSTRPETAWASLLRVL